jgi:hypothetical protein
VTAIDRRRLLGALGAVGAGISVHALPLAAAASSSTSSPTPDGSETAPAPSARALQDIGVTTDGWYWIRTSSMPVARLVYCNMSDEGGGWMLVSYSPDHSTSGSRYPNGWIAGQGTLDRMAADTMALWFHAGAAQCDTVLKMASTVAGRVPLLSAMSIANRVSYTNPQDLALVPYGDGAYAITSTLALDGTWRGVKGHTAMTGALTVNAPRDWIVTTNTYWSVCGPSSDLRPSGRSGNGQGTSSATHPSAFPLYGMANVATTADSLSTTLRTYAVLVR